MGYVVKKQTGVFNFANWGTFDIILPLKVIIISSMEKEKKRKFLAFEKWFKRIWNHTDSCCYAHYKL